MIETEEEDTKSKKGVTFKFLKIINDKNLIYGLRIMNHLSLMSR